MSDEDTQQADYYASLDNAPDAFNPDLYCRAWTKAPRVIGQGSHTHICRAAPQHDGPHVCTCGAHFSGKARR